MHVKDVMRMELIGRNIEIIKSKNHGLKGIKGKVMDETKNMITVNTNKGEKKIIKDQIVLRTEIKGNLVEINGSKLVNRPEARLKKIRK